MDRGIVEEHIRRRRRIGRNEVLILKATLGCLQVDYLLDSSEQRSSFLLFQAASRGQWSDASSFEAKGTHRRQYP